MVRDSGNRSSGTGPRGDSSETVTIELNDLGEPVAKPEEQARNNLGRILVGRYRLVELLGEGGMSRVYKAIDSDQNRIAIDQYVSVKVFKRPCENREATLRAFGEEVARLRVLEHPHIARTSGCACDSDTLFVVHEFVRGRSLYTLMHPVSGHGGDGPLSITACIKIIGQIADALGFANKQGIVHGDMKPGNVLVSDSGDVKIIDFARRPEGAAPRRVQEDSMVVRARTALTPRYASPQQLEGQKPEPCDDVYALAALSYELLTHHHPFDDPHEARQRESMPPLRRGLTPAQHAAIVHGLQPDRALRAAGTEQFIAEFAARPARSSWRTSAAVAAAVLVLLGATWLVTHRTSPPVSPTASAIPARPLAPPVAAIARFVPGPGAVIRDCPTCPALVIIPAGRFSQGAAENSTTSSFEKPQHTVVLAHPFALATGPVAVADFQAFIAATGRNVRGCDVYDGTWRHQASASWNAPGFSQSPLNPVTCVSWDDAAAYAAWLAVKTGHHYRLPSAAEWEYAARANKDHDTPWQRSADAACKSANVADRSALARFLGWTVFPCDDGYTFTAPVGTYTANALGLYDMLGNVFQWTQDCWHPDYVGASADGRARTHTHCSQHELRGGSWFTNPGYVRASYRNHFAADYRTTTVGFRVARDLSP